MYTFIRFASLLLLTYCGQSINAQITAWDLMEVPTGGCPIPPFQDTATTDPVWIPTPIRNFTYVPSTASVPSAPPRLYTPDSISRLFLPYLAKDYPRGDPTDLDFFTEQEFELPLAARNSKSGLVRFASGNRYGIRLAQGDTLIQATHHFIESANRKDRFIGYDKRFANLYDLENTALLEAQYLHIRPISNGYSIVQKPSGYGLIDSTGTEVVSCKYWSIREVKSNGKTAVNIRDSHTTAFVFIPSDLLKIRIPALQGRSTLYKDRYLSVGQFELLFDLELMTNITCSKDYEVSLTTGDSTVMQIQDIRNRKYGTYLPRRIYSFHPDGKLLVQDTTVTSPYWGANDGNIRVEKWVEDRERSFYGLIDLQGNWVLKPIYKEVKAISKSHFVITLEGASSMQVGVFNVVTKSFAIPMKNYGYKLNSTDRYISFYSPKDAITGVESTTLYRLPLLTKMFTTDGELSSFQTNLCGDTIIIGRRGMKRNIFYPDGRLVLSDTLGFIQPPGLNNYLAVTTAEGVKMKLDCSGNLVEFPPNDLTLTRTLVGKSKPGDSIYLFKNQQRELLLKTPQGEYPVDRRFKKVSAIGFRNLLMLYDNAGNNAVMDTYGNVVIPNFRGYLARPGSISPYLSISFSDGYRNYIGPDGKLLFEGQYESVRKIGIGLFSVRIIDWYAVTNESGEILLPMSQSPTLILGGMIVRGGVVDGDNKMYYRDGTLIGE